MWIRRNSRSVPAILLGVVPVLLAMLMVGTARAEGTVYGANWQMNETSGQMLDSSGNGNNSYLIEPHVGRDGSVYQFNRGRVEVKGTTPSLVPGSRDFTLTARIHLNMPIVSENYVQKGTYSQTGQEIKIENSGNHLHCRVAGSLGVASVWAFGKAPVLANGYHTVACKKTATAVQLLLDGHLLHQQLISVGNLTNSKANWSLGGKDPCLHPGAPDPAGCDYLLGSMDWVTITYP